MDNKKKVLKYLIEAEKLAEEILSEKNEIILLDERRNGNREAIRALKKSSQKKCWTTVGCVLIKENVEDTISRMEAEQKEVNIDINKRRSDLKVKVNNLRDLEMLPPIPGLMLIPMTPIESEGLSKAGLFPK